MIREKEVRSAALAKGRDPDVEWLTTKIGDALAAFQRDQPEGPTEHDVVYDTIVAHRNGPLLVGFLTGLRDAEDMPMHHAADISQYLVEALGQRDATQ